LELIKGKKTKKKETREDLTRLGIRVSKKSLTGAKNLVRHENWEETGSKNVQSQQKDMFFEGLHLGKARREGMGEILYAAERLTERRDSYTGDYNPEAQI